MKTPLHKSRHARKAPFGARSVAILASLALSGAASAVWITPYAPGSTPDQILHFDNGAGGTVTAPQADTILAGITYNNTEVSGSGGGWNITTQGSAKVSVLNNPVLTTQSQTSVSQSLLFNTVTGGDLGQIVGVSPTIIWSATGDILGSNTWDAQGGTDYRYIFDLSINGSLLSGGASLFNGVSLTISAGGNVLYSATGLTTILGLPSIIDTTYLGVAVNFAYDQADGPLEIEWAASSLVGASVLSGLGTGTQNLFEFSNGEIQVDAIPEPSTYLFLSAIGIGAFGWRFRRGLR